MKREEFPMSDVGGGISVFLFRFDSVLGSSPNFAFLGTEVRYRSTTCYQPRLFA
jgi:hypothetical protein